MFNPATGHGLWYNVVMLLSDYVDEVYYITSVYTHMFQYIQYAYINNLD